MNSKKNPFLIRKIRGFRDLFSEELDYFNYFNNIADKVLNSFGYRQILIPVIEDLSLFKRSIGEYTDITQKEMFLINSDKNDENIVLRPEGTAGCVRAGIESSKFRHQIQKWYYKGSMFRRERPQLGRYREFFQLGIETFGISSIIAELELLLLCKEILSKAKLIQFCNLEINYLCQADQMSQYIIDLRGFLEKVIPTENKELKDRIINNPLRIFDTKNKLIDEKLKDAPIILNYLPIESKNNLKLIMDNLNLLNINYKINYKLVRGLDYYDGLVFEWTTEYLGAQSTVCGGGRYDNLVSTLGGDPTPAVGCAFGLDRIVLLLQKVNDVNCRTKNIAIVFDDKEIIISYQFQWLNWLRENFCGISFSHYPIMNFEKYIKYACRNKMDYLIIIDKNSVMNLSCCVKMKNLKNKSTALLPLQDIKLFTKKDNR